MGKEDSYLHLDDIEILSGKTRNPEGGHKHTLLVGKCQVKRNGSNLLINNWVRIDGCPPNEEDFYKAYRELGIDLQDNFMELILKIPEYFTYPSMLVNPSSKRNFSGSNKKHG